MVCESCGAAATVELPDGSLWCETCDNAADDLGYQRTDLRDMTTQRQSSGSDDE